MELLKDYDCSILYHPGKANVVVDALSKKLTGSFAHISRKEIDNKRATFTSVFWQQLHKALGTRLDFSTTFHPQTDSQSERTIQNFKDMLWMCNGYW